MNRRKDKRLLIKFTYTRNTLLAYYKRLLFYFTLPIPCEKFRPGQYARKYANQSDRAEPESN